MTQSQHRSFRLPKRYTQAVFIFFMTLLMCTIMSAVMTALAGGQGSFLSRWLAGFIRSYLIVVPIVLVVSPIARRLTAMVMEE